MRSDADERADTDARADADVPLCRNRLRLARFKMLILYEGRGFGRPRGAFPDEPSCFDCMRQLVDMAIDLGLCESSAFRRIAKTPKQQNKCYSNRFSTRGKNGALISTCIL